MAQVPELSPTAFIERWPDYGHTVTLLDVREPDELERAAVTGAVSIPMREVPERVAEMDRTKPIVVMCRSGARSRVVAQYLRENGFENVYNLAGGIDAWSLQVDSSIPRY